MWHVPDVRRDGLVPPLELPHDSGIPAMPLLQAGEDSALMISGRFALVG
jgi:hypothetical protein